VAAQLRQQVQVHQLTPAASYHHQPVITSTSSAPDVLYNEAQLPVGYSDNISFVNEAPLGSAEFNHEPGSMPPSQKTSAVMQIGFGVVPAYRPAPDYDVVMQQRMLTRGYLPYVQPYLNADCTSFSQPDIYQHSAVVGHWNPVGAR